MFKPSVTIAEVVSLLNELAVLDPDAMHALVENRVVCNDALADHPTVQVASRGEWNGAGYEFGILGVLNGLFGSDEAGWGAIAAVFGNEDRRLVGFVARPTTVRISRGTDSP